MKRLQKNCSFLICMFAAICSRVILIGIYPGGINADEAFAGYEAWSVLNYGVDSWGYSYPVYFTVWGSGMSVLNSYLMLPFIKLFGLNTITVRIPQMLLGIITVYIFYCLLKKTTSEKTALWGMFLLAISPWHIITSRYGMDANLAPAFILLGIYFGVLGLEKNKYLIISAMFWGLSLYTYAAIWTFVPVFMALSIIYCMYARKIKLSIPLISAVVVLFIIALPLLIFVAVNLGLLPEIRTRVMSIPKLVGFRGDEISLKDFPSNIILALKIFISQNDYNIWNSIPYFGIYYLFSTPFIIAGMVCSLKNAIDAFKNKAFSYDFMLLVWVFIAFLLAVLQRTNFNRINDILLAMFILLAKGLVWFCEKVKHNSHYIMLIVYVICFAIFEQYYFTGYQDIISERQLAGADKALEYAAEKFNTQNYNNIYVTGQLRHSQVLFYTQYPTSQYMNEVEWQNYPDKYLVAKRFGSFCWSEEEDEPDNKGIYLILKSEIAEYEQAGYCVEPFEYCAVAYMD